MTLTIEVINTIELEKVLLLFKSLQFENVKIVANETLKFAPIITKGDKKLNPRELFGIWKDNPRTLATIRTTNWQRNWNLK